MTTTCVCEYPCDCGSPTERILTVLANTLRQQHHPGLPWHQLKDSEREQWLQHARALVATNNREPA